MAELAEKNNPTQLSIKKVENLFRNQVYDSNGMMVKVKIQATSLRRVEMASMTHFHEPF